MPKTIFDNALKVAIEANNGSAPSVDPNPSWWQGGRWIDISTEGLPGLMDRQAIIFPSGAAGKRNVNTRAPVQGRAWSDGNFGFPITEDFLGVLLFGALGTLSSNSVPSSDPTIASGAPLIDATTSAVDISAQPSDGGAILRFDIQEGSAAAATMSGWISISGVNSDGKAATEVISIASGGSFYTRTSWSSIDTSGITINSSMDGTAVISAFQYWEHTFSPGPSNPTISIEKLGDPTAGAASQSFMHTSMVITELTLNTPAAQRDGLITGNAGFEGNATATCTATSYNATSAVKVWPSWGLSISRDSAAWNKVTNFSFTIATGNRNYRAAAGVRNPQGSFFGPREVTGSFDILVDNEEEFNRWRGASSMELTVTWNSPHKLTSTQNQSLSGLFSSAYLDNIDIGDDEDAFSMSADFRTIEDATNDVATFTLINGIPGIAYGNSVD